MKTTPRKVDNIIRMLPNFLYIGPPKSGSSWIYEALRVHPEVYMPEAKEIYYFDRYYDRGLKWYEGFFEGAGASKARGEISHDYLFSSDVCDRIKQTIPDARLMACLRNPIERSFSAYLFVKRLGWSKSDFITVATKERPKIVERSCYAKPLRKYIETFGRDRLLLLHFGELKRDPGSFASSMYDFIGVDPDFRPEEVIGRKVLPAAKARSGRISNIVKRGALKVREWGAPDIVTRVKRSSLVQKLLYVPFGERDYPKPTEEEVAFMNDYFSADISELEDLLGEDFSQWRKPDVTYDAPEDNSAEGLQEKAGD